MANWRVGRPGIGRGGRGRRGGEGGEGERARERGTRPLLSPSPLSVSLRAPPLLLPLPSSDRRPPPGTSTAKGHTYRRAVLLGVGLGALEDRLAGSERVLLLSRGGSRLLRGPGLLALALLEEELANGRHISLGGVDRRKKGEKERARAWGRGGGVLGGGGGSGEAAVRRPSERTRGRGAALVSGSFFFAPWKEGCKSGRAENRGGRKPLRFTQRVTRRIGGAARSLPQEAAARRLSPPALKPPLPPPPRPRPACPRSPRPTCGPWA